MHTPRYSTTRKSTAFEDQTLEQGYQTPAENSIYFPLQVSNLSALELTEKHGN